MKLSHTFFQDRQTAFLSRIIDLKNLMCDAKVMRQMSDDIIQFHAID